MIPPDEIVLPPTAGCLPTDQQRRLLRAACLAAEPARVAWQEWRSQNSFESADVASTRLLPWIYLRRNELGVTEQDAAELHSRYRFVWLRNQILLNRCAETLRTLRLAGVETMLLKGVPLLLEAYRDEGVRYMEDFDVMVREEQAERAIEALTGAGWKPLVAEKVTAHGRTLRHSHEFRNVEGEHCDLHWQLFPRPYAPATEEPLWQERRRLVVREESTSMPCLEHLIVHLLVHGMAWETIPPIRWMLDLHRLLAHASPRWDVVFAEAKRRHLELPVCEALKTYESVLPGQLGAGLVERLNRDAPHAEQHQAYKLISLPFEKLGWHLQFRTMLKVWSRARAAGTASGGPLGFLRFLCQRWNICSPLALPFEVLRRLRRR